MEHDRAACRHARQLAPPERRRIFEIHVARRSRDPGRFELEQLAEASDGFSGAEIEEAVVSALYDVFHLGRDIATPDVLNAIQATVALSKTMSEEITALRTWAQGRARFASRRDAQSPPQLRRKLEIETHQPLQAGRNT